MTAAFSESVVEDAALAWLESLGYAVKHGPDITPGGATLAPTLYQWERESYSQVMLAAYRRQLLQNLQQFESREYAENAYSWR